MEDPITTFSTTHCESAEKPRIVEERELYIILGIPNDWTDIQCEEYAEEKSPSLFIHGGWKFGEFSFSKKQGRIARLDARDFLGFSPMMAAFGVACPGCGAMRLPHHKKCPYPHLAPQKKGS